jgi:hypothetical protein
MIGIHRKIIPDSVSAYFFLEVLRKLWKISLRTGDFRVNVLSWKPSKGKQKRPSLEGNLCCISLKNISMSIDHRNSAIQLFFGGLAKLCSDTYHSNISLLDYLLFVLDL